MAARKSPKRNQQGRRKPRSVERGSSIQIRDITDNRGKIIVVGRDFTKIVRQRALTAAEAANKARLMEIKLLAEGVGKYANSLRNKLESASDSSTPYRGLLDYRLEDAQNFFGRDHAINQTTEMLSQSAFSVLHAESGAGKTSLLQAGVVPAILASGHLPVYLRPYDKNPEETIKSLLLPDSEYTPGLAKESLADFLRRVTNILGAKTALVLILDQFEEFFYRLQEPDRKSFIDSLAKCVNNPSLNVRWLFCLRKEYFSDLTAFRPGVPDPFENAYYLQPMTRSEAEEAIAKPARLKKIGFEKGLIPELLNDLGNEKILPSHIQLVCSALVENLHGKQAMFSRADYVKLGKAQGILKNHLDRVLTEKVPKNRTAICQQVLEGLVTSTQQRVMKTEQELFTALGGFPKEQVRDAIGLLATNRLLRGEDTDKGPAYELAHDILLDEIKLNPEIVKRKEAEELLEQGMQNWKNHQLLIPPDAIKVIEKQNENIQIFPDQAVLLFLSAIENKQNAKKWTSLITVPEREKLVARLLLGMDTRNTSDGLWYFLSALPLGGKLKVITRKFGASTVRTLWKATIILSVSIIITTVIALAINRTLIYKKWSLVTGYQKNCLAGDAPIYPQVAIDVFDKSHLVVYDSGRTNLCETYDTGATWTIIQAEVLRDTVVSSIFVSERIYLLTNHGIAIQQDDLSWLPIRLPSELDSPYKAIAVFPNQKVIYISGEDTLFKYDTKMMQWEPVIMSDVTGKITDIALNYKYIAISTTDGIWYQNLTEDNTWIRYNDHNRLSKGNWVVSINMVQPVRTLTRIFIDLGNDDQFLALTNTGRIYSGKLSESETLVMTHKATLDIQSHAVSLAVNGYAKFATSNNELFCEQSWTILDKEWSLYKYYDKKPCE